MTEEKTTAHSRQRYKKIPPDGGYGWIIVGAVAIFYGIVFSMGSIFGLMYKAKILELNLNAQQIATVISVSYGFGTGTGLIGGPLINYFGYRIMALVAAGFQILGIIISAYVTTYTAFLFSYSIVTALAYGFGVSAYLVALTDYFVKNRAKASGISMTLTAIGPIIYPQLVTLFLDLYGPHTTILLVAIICLHSIAAGLLLQPAKWHFISIPVEPDTESFICKNGNVVEMNHVSGLHEKNAEDAEPSEDVKNNIITNFFHRIVKLFDLKLLLDIRFVNIVLVLGFADFSELTFLTITPFVLEEKNYSTGEIAIILSIMGTADIISRFSSPFFGDFFRQKPRVMFMYSLFIFIISRTTLHTAESYAGVLIAAISVGVARGIAYVYWNLVIPCYVPIERLPAATGIQMISSAIWFVTMGPFVGILRDMTGNYFFSIAHLNSLSFISIILWSIELFYDRKK